MNNPSFEIYVNNQLVSIAGITAEFGVVTAMTTWVNSHVIDHKDLTFTVSGLDSVEEQYLTWFEKKLDFGDEVTIKITDNRNISSPTLKPKMSESESLESKISYFHRLKEELKDYV